VLSVENVTLMLVCLNIFVMNKVSRPMYVNLAHLYLSVSWFGCFFLNLILSKTNGSYLLYNVFYLFSRQSVMVCMCSFYCASSK
jgi:hypothetical protein